MAVGPEPVRIHLHMSPREHTLPARHNFYFGDLTMSLTPEQQRAIIEKESAWTDENFGQLDLSAFPALAPQPEPETHDSKFARDWSDTGLNRSAADLRAFIEDPDLESLARVAKSRRSPGKRHNRSRYRASPNL